MDTPSPSQSAVAPKVEEALSGVGVCIKNAEFRVLYQDKKCLSRCGEKLGSVCKEGCSQQLKLAKWAGQLFKTKPFVSQNSEMIECVIVNNGEFITTLQMPVDKRFDQIFHQISKFKLTATESIVLKSKICGWSLREIAERLFISRATVKTHLNNIYVKIPADLKLEILRLK